jgi:hypothetical protein
MPLRMPQFGAPPVPLVLEALADDVVETPVVDDVVAALVIPALVDDVAPPVDPVDVVLCAFEQASTKMKPRDPKRVMSRWYSVVASRGERRHSLRHAAPCFLREARMHDGRFECRALRVHERQPPEPRNHRKHRVDDGRRRHGHRRQHADAI